MAVTSYAVGDSLTAKRYARRLFHEALLATEIAPLIGTDASAVIQRKDEPKKEKGDQVTVGLRMQLTGDGVTEGEALEGNEESLTTYSDALILNELSHAVRIKGDNTIDNQRILFNTRTEAKAGLRDWYAKRMSVSFFLHAAGYNGASYTHFGSTIDPTKTVYNMGNTINGPSSNRHIWAAAGAGETNSADENLESDDIFDLRLIDYAKEQAMTGNGGSTPPIRPIRVNGEEHYVIYLHPYQVTDMRTSTDTGQWQDIQKAAMNGGKVSNNPIFSGALGVYNNVIIRSSNDIAPGVNSSTNAAITTVRRAVLLGAQAGLIGYGSGFDEGDGSYKWVEETFDYKRELGVSVQSLCGLKKARFNSEDFGAYVVSTYAAAHT